MPTLQVRLLGDFHLLYEGEPVTTVNQTRLQSLLAYLVLHHEVPQARQRLAFLFWPDTTEAQALTNLRNLLHKLRRSLPEPERFVCADTHTVQWHLDSARLIDVVAFEAALAQAVTRAELEQAVKLYRGDLLPSCYDDWIVPERERLRQRAMDALTRLIDLLEEERAYRAAIGYGQRLQQLDPLNEATYCRLMRLHAADGDRAGALRLYQTCVKMLQDELAAPPSPATHELYQRLLSTDVTPPARTGQVQGQPPLVGRRTEWKRLLDAWYAASSGKSHCVILAGEAGIGKTRLAEELLTWVSRQGFATATAHCYAAEGALAYAPVVSWLRSAALGKRLSTLEPVWLGEVARLRPEVLVEQPGLSAPGLLTEGWQRQRLFDALARAILKPDEALCLFLDDLQWSDRDTLEWLHYLLRFDHPGRAQQHPGMRLLLVGTVRSEEVTAEHPLAALLGALRRAGQLTEIEVGPLSTAETTSLAAAVAGQTLTPAQAARLYAETEGNPLFVVETIRSGPWEAERLEVEPHVLPSRVVSLQPLPPRIHTVIHARLAQLSPSARELAGLAAASGREFTFGVLAQASGQDDDTLVRSLDELCQRRIVRERGAVVYDFTHDKLREVAYTSLSAARRRYLHRRIAQAIEVMHASTLDAVSAQVAAHYELAGQLEQAIPYCQRAAEMAQRVYANAEAIRYYRRALALSEGLSGQSQELAMVLHQRLGDVLHLTGQYDDARIAYRRALARASLSDPIACACLHRKMGNTWREQYRYREALQAYTEAESVLSATPAPGLLPSQTGEPQLDAVRQSPAWWQERIQVLMEIDTVHYWLGQVHESAALQRRLQLAVEQVGTPGQRASFLQHRSMTELRRQRGVATDEIVAWAKAALAALQEVGNQASIPSAQFQLGFATLLRGDPHGALAPLQTALHLSEQTGDITLQARCLTYLTVAHRQCGQWEQTRQHALRSLAVATAAHMPEYMGTAEANQAWVAWTAGDLQAAGEHGHAALAYWHSLPASHASIPFQWTALWPLIAVALGERQIATAMDYTRKLLDPAQQRIPDALAALLEQAVEAWDRGEPESARASLQQAQALAQQLHYL